MFAFNSLGFREFWKEGFRPVEDTVPGTTRLFDDQHDADTLERARQGLLKRHNQVLGALGGNDRSRVSSSRYTAAFTFYFIPIGVGRGRGGLSMCVLVERLWMQCSLAAKKNGPCVGNKRPVPFACKHVVGHGVATVLDA